MNKNVGGIDRLSRYAIGVTLIAMTLTGFIGVWGWVGLVPLFTALFGTCPLYSLLGVRTCKAGRLS
jgi:membrane-associated HD superfamily phosphohydrolase